jgi:hypothetical protein
MRKLSLYLPVILLALIPAVAAGQTYTFNFATPVVLAPTETPGAWYPDRYPPCGFSSPAVAPDGALNSLHESICASDYQTPLYAYPIQLGNFYNTQGRKYDLPANVTTVSIELYVPSSWATSLNRRIAGFWATADDSANVVANDYPIIEFQGPTTTDSPAGPKYWPNGGVAGFYGWNNTANAGNGGYDYIGLPAGFTYNSWVQLTMTLVPGTGFVYTVSGPSGLGAVSITSPFFDPTEVSLANVILEGYNYDADYSIYWNNAASVLQRAQDGPVQIHYFAPQSYNGDGYINVMNDGYNGDPLQGPAGGSAGNICVNVFAFDANDEEEIACCSCLVTPNGAVSLDIAGILTNTATGIVPAKGETVKLVATEPTAGFTGTSCSGSALAVGTTGVLATGMVAWGTTLALTNTSGSYATVETPFIPVSPGTGAAGSNTDLVSIASRCAFLINNGSGAGLCPQCTAGTLGAAKM